MTDDKVFQFGVDTVHREGQMSFDDIEKPSWICPKCGWANRSRPSKRCGQCGAPRPEDE